jgi:hypothetical protein
VYRIGFIVTAMPNETGHLVKALNEGLRELGYLEGRNVVFSGGLRRGGKSGYPCSRRSLLGEPLTSRVGASHTAPRDIRKSWKGRGVTCCARRTISLGRSQAVTAFLQV